MLERMFELCWLKGQTVELKYKNQKVCPSTHKSREKDVERHNVKKELGLKPVVMVLSQSHLWVLFCKGCWHERESLYLKRGTLLKQLIPDKAETSFGA